jgi:hypothetical protein
MVLFRNALALRNDSFQLYFQRSQAKPILKSLSL